MDFRQQALMDRVKNPTAPISAVWFSASKNKWYKVAEVWSYEKGWVGAVLVDEHGNVKEDYIDTAQIVIV